jgi:hypothetical protein
MIQPEKRKHDHERDADVLLEDDADSELNVCLAPKKEASLKVVNIGGYIMPGGDTLLSAVEHSN